MKYQREKIDENDALANDQIQSIQKKGMQGLSEINKKFAKEMGVDIEIQQDFNFSKIGEFLIVKNQSYLAIWDVSKQV